MDTKSNPAFPILIVDDEEHIVSSLSTILKSHGFTNVETCIDARKVLGLAAELAPDVIVLDLRMPYMSGQELLEELHLRHPDIPVIIVTASDDIDDAVKCMQTGAVDYMVKAVEESRFVSGVRRAVEYNALRRNYDELKSRLVEDTLVHPEAFSSILSRSRKMHSLYLLAESVAVFREPVLIRGETGVGKNLFANAIHKVSNRSGNLISVDVAGLDDTMFSDTLFGHVKGAYTGATESRDGLASKALDGTLLLDEIGDVSLPSQTKLLRFLDENEYLPLGSDTARRSNARMIFATNRDLEQLIESNKFRRDLYYRLKTHEISIPPLRERKEDISLLFNFYMREAAAECGKEMPQIPPQISLILENYDFPGNVRELRSAAFNIMATQKSSSLSGTSVNAALGIEQTYSEGDPGDESDSVDKTTFGDRLPTLRQLTRLLIEESLRRTKGNQSAAAALLGISHQALNKRLKRK